MEDGYTVPQQGKTTKASGTMLPVTAPNGQVTDTAESEDCETNE